MREIKLLTSRSEFQALQSQAKAGGYADLGELVGAALRLKRAVDWGMAEGYTRLKMVDPETEEGIELTFVKSGAPQG